MSRVFRCGPFVLCFGSCGFFFCILAFASRIFCFFTCSFHLLGVNCLVFRVLCYVSYGFFCGVHVFCLNFWVLRRVSWVLIFVLCVFDGIACLLLFVVCLGPSKSLRITLVRHPTFCIRVYTLMHQIVYALKLLNSCSQFVYFIKTSIQLIVYALKLLSSCSQFVYFIKTSIQYLSYPTTMAQVECCMCADSISFGSKVWRYKVKGIICACYDPEIRSRTGNVYKNMLF